MTLTEIRLRLEELGVRPSRRLGQNFMYDQNLARRIVELANIQPDSKVLEIGPGLGALTEFILEIGASFSPPAAPSSVTLIEKDHRLAQFLRERFPKTNLIEGDALDVISNFQSQLSTSLVLGNLPYSVASPIMVRLAEADLRPRRMLFTIQLEVAERLVAGPQTKDYGLLTLLTQPFYEIKIARKIPTTVFWPQPEVESAIVTMERLAQSPFANADAEARFRKMVKLAFQQRRKTLGSIFGKELPAHIERQRRPEDLNIQEWVQAVGEPKPFPPPPAEELFDVVNDADQVIRTERRSVVHQQGLLHRAIHIFIWNNKGELLLQKRSASKDVSPNTWDSSAAGHLGVGENYDTAANREIVEELGIHPQLVFVQRFKACSELGWEFVHLYQAKSEGPFKFPESEISEVRWWKKQDIDQAIETSPKEFARSFCYLWKHFQISNMSSNH